MDNVLPLVVMAAMTIVFFIVGYIALTSISAPLSLVLMAGMCMGFIVGVLSAFLHVELNS